MMEMVYFLLVVFLLAVLFLCIKGKKRMERQRENELLLMGELTSQGKQQTELMSRQLENEGVQIELSKETADRMSELAGSLEDFSKEMRELRVDIEYIKNVMIEEEVPEHEGSIILTEEKFD